LDQSADDNSAMTRTPSPACPAVTPYHSYLSFVSTEAKIALQL
jgi:hypothetical protein